MLVIAIPPASSPVCQGQSYGDSANRIRARIYACPKGQNRKAPLGAALISGLHQGAGHRHIQFMSPSEQAPGPRGSPQDPQAPLADAEADDPLADTAKTESCGSSFVVWHLGHSAFSLP